MGSFDDKVHLYKLNSQAVPELKLVMEVDLEKEMSRVVCEDHFRNSILVILEVI